MKALMSVCCAGVMTLALLPCVAQAQSGSNAAASSEVAKYVARTWEVSSSDFQVRQLKDEDGLLVYRVTLRADNKTAPAMFRVIDIYVDPSTAAVVGERQVR